MYLCVTRALDECDLEMEVAMLSPPPKKEEKNNLLCQLASQSLHTAATGDSSQIVSNVTVTPPMWRHAI